MMMMLIVIIIIAIMIIKIYTDWKFEVATGARYSTPWQ